MKLNLELKKDRRRGLSDGARGGGRKRAHARAGGGRRTKDDDVDLGTHKLSRAARNPDVEDVLAQSQRPLLLRNWGAPGRERTGKAIRYNKMGGEGCIRTGAGEGWAFVPISNTDVCIPAEDLPTLSSAVVEGGDLGATRKASRRPKLWKTGQCPCRGPGASCRGHPAGPSHRLPLAVAAHAEGEEEREGRDE